LHTGFGIGRNEAEAAKYGKLSADEGNSDRQLRHGLYLQSRIDLGTMKRRLPNSISFQRIREAVLGSAVTGFVSRWVLGPGKATARMPDSIEISRTNVIGPREGFVVHVDQSVADRYFGLACRPSGP
jgi:TPR repeat protein